jgi:hypothetical protein
MSGTFDFCPGRCVPRTKPPEASKGMSMGGWFFSSRPVVPYQKSFAVKLQGIRWYLNADGTYDAATDPQFNARRLELFYEQHGTWDPFDWQHPHLGLIKVRFKEPVEVAEAIPNSGGLVEGFDIQLVHHNPGFA